MSAAPTPEGSVAEVWSVAEQNGHCYCIGHTASVEDVKLCRVHERVKKQLPSHERVDESRLSMVSHKQVERSKFSNMGHEQICGSGFFFFKIQSHVHADESKLLGEMIRSKNCNNTAWCRDEQVVFQSPVSCCGREWNATMTGVFLQERCGFTTQ